MMFSLNMCCQTWGVWEIHMTVFTVTTLFVSGSHMAHGTELTDFGEHRRSSYGPGGIVPQLHIIGYLCKSALQHMENDAPINFSKKPHDIFRDSVSSTVRQCMMKIRDLKRVSTIYQTAIKKAR